MTNESNPESHRAGRTERAAEWIYSGLWRILVDWFCVPDEPPTLPVRPGDHIEAFQPAPGFLRYLKLWFWIVGLLIDVGLVLAFGAALIALFMAGFWWVAVPLIPIMLAIIIVPDIIAFIAVHLRYDTTWYVMTDRSVRIRRGIWVIQETTITFENVQNLKVSQGPVQRAFGISSLELETAGSGASTDSKGRQRSMANRAVIEGVTDAQRLRDMILPRIQRSRSAGLGDEARSTTRHGEGTWTAEHLAVLREIRDEIAAISA
jgi:membrane protein YdbS with pleckstrin-like domain